MKAILVDSCGWCPELDSHGTYKRCMKTGIEIIDTTLILKSCPLPESGVEASADGKTPPHNKPKGECEGCIYQRTLSVCRYCIRWKELDDKYKK